jgi:hypothetical protein
VAVPQEIWGSTDRKKKQVHRGINTVERRKSAREILTIRLGDIAATHNIPYQPQFVAHGQNCGENTLERLKPNPTCVEKDTIKGIT